MMNQSLSDLMGVNSLPPIGSIHTLPDVSDSYGIQRTQGRTYLRAGTLARSSLFPSVPNHLKPVGNMGIKTGQLLNMPVGDMASDGKNAIVAVAYDSTVYTSLDSGDTWTSRGKLPSSAGYSWSIATDGNGLWLAMARDGTVVRSTDNFSTWVVTLTAAQAALVGAITFACRLDYANGEFWVSRLQLTLSQFNSNNNHCYRLNSAGTVLTPISLPATGADNASYFLCGVFGNGKSLHVLFNRIGVNSAVSSGNNWTYVYTYDVGAGAFLAPYVICWSSAMSMAWDESQGLWITYGNHVYSSALSMDVRIYDIDLKLVASWSPAIGSPGMEGYFPSSPPADVVSWGDWGALLKLNRNFCIDTFGRSGGSAASSTFFVQRPLGGSVAPVAFGISPTLYSGAGVRVNRDLVVIHSNSSREIIKIPSCVGLVAASKPSTDTAVYMRVG